MSAIDFLQWLLTAAGAFVGWIFGGLDGLMFALVVFVVIDYLTGVLAAAVKKQLSSEVGFKGIVKKTAIFCLVAVAHIVDAYVLQRGSAFRTAVLCFYLSNEGISIVENAVAIGIPVPEKLKNILKQIENK